MVKIKFLIVCFALSILLTGCNNNSNSDLNSEQINNSNVNISKYESLVIDFLSVDVNEIIDLQNNGEVFYLYTGRKDCPYCLNFVIGINRIKNEFDTSIYYLDSIYAYENCSEDIKQFRDLYSIKTVPSLILFKGNEAIANLSDYLHENNDAEVIKFLNIYKEY